jgi:hypothetical protein
MSAPDLRRPEFHEVPILSVGDRGWDEARQAFNLLVDSDRLPSRCRVTPTRGAALRRGLVLPSRARLRRAARLARAPAVPPDRFTTWTALLRFPDDEAIPEPLRGGAFAVVMGASREMRLTAGTSCASW